MTEFLEEEYTKLSDELKMPNLKLGYLNNIIQIKIENSEYKSHKHDISIDIKNYINLSITVSEEGQHRYDNIKANKFEEFITPFSFEEKIYYINYFLRQLQKSEFRDEVRSFQKLKSKLIILKSLKTIYYPKSFFKFIINFPLYNLFTLFVTLLIVGLLAAIISLPAPFSFMFLLDFEVEYVDFSNNKILNHFLNILGCLAGINEDLTFKPNNEFTFFVLFIGKMFMFIYVTSLVLNKLTELIKR